VQQNAATAEESASASEEMNAQAEQMEEMVQNLNAMITKVKNVSSEKGPESVTDDRLIGTTDVSGEEHGTAGF
jgi:methyl-accepting chemotaxis protein